MINNLYEMSKKQHDTLITTVLMFTDSHPHVIKVLEDKCYYKALDDISGADIAVFHTRLFAGKFVLPSPPPGTLCYMTPIWKEPAANKALLNLFDMSDSKDLPALVTFLFHNGDIYHAHSKVKDDSEQTVFNSLKEILEILAVTARGSKDKLLAVQEAKLQMRKLNFKKGFKEFTSLLGQFRGASGL